MNRGGITKRIVNAANAMVGHVSKRGPWICIQYLPCLLCQHGWVCPVASTRLHGAILIPMMVRAE